MRIIGKRDIERYMTRRANAATPLRCWVQKAEQSDWKTPSAIKADFLIGAAPVEMMPA